jgi:hypothetical protein
MVGQAVRKHPTLLLESHCVYITTRGLVISGPIVLRMPTTKIIPTLAAKHSAAGHVSTIENTISVTHHKLSETGLNYILYIINFSLPFPISRS